VNYPNLKDRAPNFYGLSNHFIAGSGWFTTAHGQKGTCPNAYIFGSQPHLKGGDLRR